MITDQNEIKEIERLTRIIGDLTKAGYELVDLIEKIMGTDLKELGNFIGEVETLKDYWNFVTSLLSKTKNDYQLEMDWINE